MPTEQVSVASLAVVCLIFLLHSPSGVYANLEVDALSVFKGALDDPNNAIVNWDNMLVNPTTWWHVDCNSDNSVIKINLGRKGFSGRLVANLGKLKNLQHMLLNNNNISGAIPNEIGDLTNLVNLDLYNNILSGSIPDSLGNLSKLRYLRLHDNSLTNYIPQKLALLQNLLVLDLSNNHLSGRIPTELFKLPKLRYINLSSNNLSGNISDELAKKIEFLDLSKNPFLTGACTKSPCHN